MANTLQIKRSTTATNTPTLAAGELGVNLTDNKLWVGDGTNNLLLNPTSSLGDTLYYSQDAQIQISDDSTNSNYHTMREFHCDRAGSFRVKFSAYIVSGSYWWAWRVYNATTSTVLYSGSYTNNLDTGESAQVHQYRRYKIDVDADKTRVGDKILIQMVSSNSGGTPVAGNGQNLTLKEFRVYLNRQYSAPINTPNIGGTYSLPLTGGLFLKASEAHDTYTKLLIHSDEPDGHKAFRDSSPSGHAITTAGDAQHKVTQKKFGSSSIKFDSTGDYLSIPDSSDWAFGTGDFTIDFWFHSTNNAAQYRGLVCQVPSPYTSATGLFITINQAQLRLYARNGSGDLFTEINSSSIAQDAWHHVAVVRSGNTMYLYKNGTSVGSSSYSGTWPDWSAPIHVGFRKDQTSYFQGYMDEVRISKGIARWTSNFTPPTSPYGVGVVTNRRLGIGTAPLKQLHIKDSGSAGLRVESTSLGARDYDFHTDGYEVYIEGVGGSSGSFQVGENGTFPFKVDLGGGGSGDGGAFYLNSSGNLLLGGTVTWASGGSANANTAYTYSQVGHLPLAGGTLTGALGVEGSTKLTGGLVTGNTIDGLPDAHTKLLIHSDTHDGSTTFVDSSPSGHAITNYDVVHKTAKSKFGATSLYIAANLDRLFLADSPDWDFGTGDFTIDCWVNPSSGGTSSSSWGGIATFSPATHQANYLNNFRFKDTSRKLSLGWNGSNVAGNTAVPLNTWSHVAVVRSGGTVTFYLNGVADGSHTGQTQSYVSSGHGIEIGSSWVGYGAYYWDGYIDEVRISKTARWTAAFTPPTRPYSYVDLNSNLNVAGYLEAPNIDGKPDAYTKLLIHSDTTDGRGTFTDSSPSGHTVSTVNDPTHETEQSKFGASSIYFDGNDYLTIPASGDWDVGTGDWTLDCWAYTTLGTSNSYLFDTRNSSNTSNFSIYRNGLTLVYYAQVASKITTGTVLTLNKWHHIALVRSGSTVTLYVDGTSAGSATDASDYQGLAPFIIGSRYSVDTHWQGYQDEFRFSKGIARWTAAFTPPTRPYATFSAGDGVFTGELLTPRLGVGAFNTGNVDYALNVVGKGLFTDKLTVLETITTTGNFNLTGGGSTSLSGTLGVTGITTATGGLLVGTSAFGGNTTYQKLQVGNTLSANSSAAAQIDGLLRTSYIITHNSGEGIRPNTDGQGTCGTSAQRWSTVYGQAGDFSGALTGTTATFSGDATFSGYQGITRKHTKKHHWVSPVTASLTTSTRKTQVFRIYFTPAHWTSDPINLEVEIKSSYYENHSSSYSVSQGYSQATPYLYCKHRATNEHRIKFEMGTVTSAGYNYSGQPAYYVDFYIWAASYMTGWVELTATEAFLTTNNQSLWGCVVVNNANTTRTDGASAPATIAANFGSGGLISSQDIYTQAINGTTATFSGALTWSGGGSANANTAYTYSQVGHLPLAGGTLTGALTGTSATFGSATTTSNVAVRIETDNASTYTPALQLAWGGDVVGEVDFQFDTRATTGFKIGTTAATHPVSLVVDDVPKIYISGYGNVGINSGTTTPIGTLQVNDTSLSVIAGTVTVDRAATNKFTNGDFATGTSSGWTFGSWDAAVYGYSFINFSGSGVSGFTKVCRIVRSGTATYAHFHQGGIFANSTVFSVGLWVRGDGNFIINSHWGVLKTVALSSTWQYVTVTTTSNTTSGHFIYLDASYITTYCELTGVMIEQAATASTFTDVTRSSGDIVLHGQVKSLGTGTSFFKGDVTVGGDLAVSGTINQTGQTSRLFNHPVPGLQTMSATLNASTVSYIDSGYNAVSGTWRGVVWTGQHYIFINTASSNQLYFYDSFFQQVKNEDGVYFETLPNSPSNPHGAAWDGRYLWVFEYDGTDAWLNAYDIYHGDITRVAHCQIDTDGTGEGAGYGVGYAEGLLYTVVDGVARGWRWDGGDTLTMVVTNSAIQSSYPNFRAQGITYDGSHLWVTQNGSNIFKLSLDGSIALNIGYTAGQTPPNITAWTWNGENIITVAYTSPYDIYIINTAQRVFLTEAVGINTITPGSALDIVSTNMSQSVGLEVTKSSSGSSSAAGHYKGAYFSCAGGMDNYKDKFGIDVYAHTNNWSHDEIFGVNVLAEKSSSGNNNVFGVKSIARCSSVYNQGGTKVFYGLYGKVEETGSETITSGYSVYADSPTGDVTNAYGFYQNGGGKNYFASALGLGADPGTYKLNVNGTTNLNGALTGTTAAFSGNISLTADDGFVYLNNAGTANSGCYIRGLSSDSMRCHVPAAKGFYWEVGGNEKMTLGSGGDLAISGTLTSTTAGTAAATAGHNWYSLVDAENIVKVKDGNELYFEKESSAPGYNKWVYWGEEVGLNFDLSFRLKMDGPSSGYRHFGIAIASDGSSTNSNFDYIVFRHYVGSSSNNQIRLDAANSTEQSLVGNTVPDFADGTERSVLIQVRNRQYTIEVDGVLEHSFTASARTRQRGLIGFTIYEAAASHTWATIRNFKIHHYANIQTTLPTIKVGTPLRQAGTAVQQQAGYFSGTKTAYAGAGNVGLWQNQLHIADDAALAAGIGGAITFGATQDNTNGTFLASIEGSRDNATSTQYGGGMIFRTRTNGAAPMGAHMFLSSTGELGLNTVTPGSYQLYCNGTSFFKNGMELDSTLSVGSTISCVSIGASSGPLLSTAHSAVSTAVGDVMSYRSDAEYTVDHDSGNQAYYPMKSFRANKSGAFRIRWSCYIQSGTYYLGYRIYNATTSTVLYSGGAYSTAGSGNGLDDGQVGYVHAYRRFRVDVAAGKANAGDLIELGMVSATYGGGPVNGNGQRLYAKEFRITASAQTSGIQHIDGNVGIGGGTNSSGLKTLNVTQTGADYGIRLNGHSAYPDSHINLRVDSSGHTNFETSGGSYTRFGIGSGYFLLTTAANEPIYMDFGGSFYWRDRDAANAIRMSLNSADGALQVNGALTVGGNCTLGDSTSADSHTINGALRVKPSSIGYVDIIRVNDYACRIRNPNGNLSLSGGSILFEYGTSSALRMKLFDSGGFAIGDTNSGTDPGADNVTIEGSLAVGSTSAVPWKLYVNGITKINGALECAALSPAADNVHALGNTSRRWSSVTAVAVTGVSGTFSGALTGTTGTFTGNMLISAASSPKLDVTATNTPVTNRLQADDNSGYLGTSTNHPLALRTNNVTRVTISAAGAATFSGALTGTSATFSGALTVNGNATLGNDDLTDSWQTYGRNINTNLTVKSFYLLASGTQGKSAEVCRLFFNLVHWGYFGATTVELYDDYYGGDGYLKYACKAGNSNSCGIELIEARGTTTGMKAEYGAAVDTGVLGGGYANYYVPVVVHCGDYRRVRVIVSTSRGIAAWANTSDYDALAFAPSISYSNISDFTHTAIPELNPTLSGGNATTPNAISALHSTRMQIQTAYGSDGTQILNSSRTMTNIESLAINSAAAGTHKLYVNGTTSLGGALTGTSATFSSYIRANYGIQDDGGSYGTSGQVLKSGGTGVVNWANESGGGGGVTGGNTGISIYNSTTVQLDVSGSDSCVNVHTAITTPNVEDYMIISDESATNDPVKKCKIKYLPLAKSSTFSASGCGGTLYMHNPNGTQQDSTSISLTCSGGGGGS